MFLGVCCTPMRFRQGGGGATITTAIAGRPQRLLAALLLGVAFPRPAALRPFRERPDRAVFDAARDRASSAVAFLTSLAPAFLRAAGIVLPATFLVFLVAFFALLRAVVPSFFDFPVVAFAIAWATVLTFAGALLATTRVARFATARTALSARAPAAVAARSVIWSTNGFPPVVRSEVTVLF